MRITREISDPTYGDKPWADRWEGPDGGLFASWERGRQKSIEEPELAERARNGELVVLPWKGGVAKKIKVPHKYGSLLYLAMWQGLRGEPLDISLEEEVTLTCTLTTMRMIYTLDSKKYAEA